MPETNPRLGRTSQSKVEQKGIIERGQESGKVSYKETCPLGGHREAGCSKSMSGRGYLAEREQRGRAWRVSGAHQRALDLSARQWGVTRGVSSSGSWLIRLSNMMLAAGWRTKQKGQEEGRDPGGMMATN